MNTEAILKQAEILAIERRPEACLGCEFENSCSLHGCAVIKMLVETVREDADVIATYEAVGPKLEDVKATIKALREIDFSSLVEAVASVTDWLLKIVNEAKDNALLTLEELREMDGEPVWLNDSRCFLVDCYTDTAYDKFGMNSSLEILADIGVFRRKPEESVNHA